MKRSLIHATSKKRAEDIIRHGFRECPRENKTWINSEQDQVYSIDLIDFMEKEIQDKTDSEQPNAVYEVFSTAIKEGILYGIIRTTIDKISSGEVGNEGVLLFFETEEENISKDDMEYVVKTQTDIANQKFKIMDPIYFKFDELGGHLAVASAIGQINYWNMKKFQTDMLESISRDINPEDISFVTQCAYDNRVTKRVEYIHKTSRFEKSNNTILDIVKNFELKK